MKRFQMPESMKVASIWVVWGFLAIGALGWALFVVLGFFGVERDAAAWVQAIGSIAAVMLAAWVANHQTAMTLQFRRDADAEALKKIVAIAKYAGKVSERCQIYVSLGDSERPHMERFLTKLEECAFLLRSVSYMQIPLAEVALGWIELRHALQEDIAWVKKWMDAPGYENGHYADLHEANTRAAHAVHRILSSASGVMPELLATEE